MQKPTSMFEQQLEREQPWTRAEDMPLPWWSELAGVLAVAFSVGFFLACAVGVIS